MFPEGDVRRVRCRPDLQDQREGKTAGALLYMLLNQTHQAGAITAFPF